MFKFKFRLKIQSGDLLAFMVPLMLTLGMRYGTIFDNWIVIMRSLGAYAVTLMKFYTIRKRKVL